MQWAHCHSFDFVVALIEFSKQKEKQKTVALNLCYSNLDLYIQYLLLLYISNRNCCKCAFYLILF